MPVEQPGHEPTDDEIRQHVRDLLDATRPRRWNLLGRLFDHIAARGIERDGRRQRAALDGRLRTVEPVARLGGLVVLVAVRAATSTSQRPALVVLHALTLVIEAACAGAWCLSGWRRAVAYRDGYDAGRDTIWRGMGEAQRRGLGVSEWIEAELERDTARWRARYGPDAVRVEVHRRDEGDDA